MATSFKSCTSKVKTVQKWKETLNADWLDYHCENNMVRTLRCKVCTMKEEGITFVTNFSHTFIAGSSIVKKNSVINHMKSDQHLMAKKLNLC